MKYALIALLSLVLSACDFFKKNTVDQVTQEEPTTTQSDRRDCEILGTASAVPLAVWSMKNGQDLFVCNHNTTSKESDDHFVGWVNLYVKGDGKIMPFISEVDSELPSELYRFSIQKNGDREVVIRKQISTSDEATWNPEDTAVEFKIDCVKGDCKKGSPSCVLKKRSELVDTNSVQMVEAIVTGKEKLPDLYDVTIKNVAKAAIFGDERALKLMLETPSAKLKIDGAASQIHKDGKEFLTELKKLNCL